MPKPPEVVGKGVALFLVALGAQDLQVPPREREGWVILSGEDVIGAHYPLSLATCLAHQPPAVVLAVFPVGFLSHPLPFRGLQKHPGLWRGDSRMVQFTPPVSLRMASTRSRSLSAVVPTEDAILISAAALIPSTIESRSDMMRGASTTPTTAAANA